MTNFPIQMERFSSAVDQQIGTRFAAKRRIKTLRPVLPHKEMGGLFLLGQKKGVYYEGWVDDVEQVIDDHKKLQSHHMAPGGLQARQRIPRIAALMKV